MKTPAIVLQLLQGAQASIDAAMLLLTETEAAPAPCEHPQDQRLDCSTMGRQAFQCKFCGQLVQTPGDEEVS